MEHMSAVAAKTKASSLIKINKKSYQNIEIVAI